MSDREPYLTALRFRWLTPFYDRVVGLWGKAQDALMRGLFIFVQLLDGFETTTDSVRGRLVEFLREAGFESVSETHRVRSILGTLSMYKATARDAGGFQ